VSAPLCSVEECERTCLARRRGDRVSYYSMCAGHRTRWYKHGDPMTGRPLRPQRARGEGWITPAGYFRYYLPGHPTADVHDRVFHHRVVLYDALGPGAHPCHWCGNPVAWETPHPGGLEVDHLDGDKTNNDLTNLVPTCHADNIRRRHAGNPVDWKASLT